MAKTRSNFKMGTVEMIVLFLLDKKECYGYELCTTIDKLSHGRLIISESTLYPTLYKLLKNNLISDHEVSVGKRRLRVYYNIEPAGRQRLADLLEDYEIITQGIADILLYDGSAEEEHDE